MLRTRVDTCVVTVEAETEEAAQKAAQALFADNRDRGPVQISDWETQTYDIEIDPEGDVEETDEDAELTL